MCCRIGKTGTLEVRTDEEPVSRTEGTSDGTFTVLALNAATANLFVGGVPHDITVRNIALHFVRIVFLPFSETLKLVCMCVYIDIQC